MTHHEGHAGHIHPETFDEVIARGFPAVPPDMAPEARDVRRSAPTLPVTPAHAMPTHAMSAHAEMAHTTPAHATQGPPPQLHAIPSVRKDQASLSAAEKAAFQAAIVRLVSDGKYLELVRHHMDMSHNMHGSMGTVGLYRFLGWHRRYLREFEKELQRVDAILRPGNTQKLGVPYWKWQDPFPTWMAGFLPALDPVSGAVPPSRKISPPPSFALAADIDTIVNKFSIQTPSVPSPNDYTKFTWGIEGWGKRPNGTGLPAHNHGHSWIGGIMNNTSTSPTDPMFWMHHAEVDRLWEIWRAAHPTPGPLLSGADRIMDPWTESYDDLTNITVLGYGYDTMTL